MELTKRHLVLGMVGILLVTGLLLVPAPPAQAGSDVFFGLTIGVPFAPYPVYAPVYTPPPVVYAYPPQPPVVVVNPGYYPGYYHRHVYGPPHGRAHGYWRNHWRRAHY